MRHAKSIACVTVVAALFVAACADRRPDSSTPTAPRLIRNAAGNVVMGTCTTIGDLNTLAAQVFGDGSPNVNSVLGKLDNLAKKVEAGNVVDAEAQANNIVTFVKDKAADGRLAGTTEQVNQFIGNVLCFAGLSPDTFLIQPTDLPQVIVNSEGTGGVSLEGSTVTVPTLLTITTLPPTGPSPLDTKLDQYPSYVSITFSSVLTHPADVRVCPTGVPDNTVRGRLRLGHQAIAGFEITPPPGRPSFNVCPPPPASISQSRAPGWLRTVASVFVPKPLYAKLQGEEEAFRGGVGGSVTEFSPFGAVDPELSLDRGGVGGSSTEFKKSPGARPGIGPTASDPSETAHRKSVAKPSAPAAPSSPKAFAYTISACADTVGSELSADCRPFVLVRTHLGTVLTGVPVAWAVTSGGGSVAAEAAVTAQCGAYAATAANTTDAGGRAAACWTLGPEAGTNSVTAIPSAGGDAPEGVSFNVPTGALFTIESVHRAATLSLSGLNHTYDGTPKSATAATTPEGLAVVSVTYDGSATAPTDAGTYAVVASLTNPSFAAPNATGSLVIAKAAQAALAVTGPDSGMYGQSVQLGTSGGTTNGAVTWSHSGSTACSVDGAGSVAITAGTGVCSITATMAGNVNYEAVTSAVFAVTVSRAPGAISISGPASLVYNTTGALTPSITGDGAVSYAVVSGPCTVSGASVTMNSGTGTCTVQATLGMGPNYLGAASNVLSIAAQKASAGMSLGSLSHQYDGTPKSATATTVPADLTSVSLTYNGSGTPPTNAGTYAVAALLTNADYTGAASGTLVVSVAPSTAQVSCPVAVTYTGSPLTPCTASVSGVAGLAQALPVTYTSNTVGTATASASYAGGTNWAASSASRQFQISYVQLGCFASPIYSQMPDSKSYQRKGSNLPVKCTLKNASGGGVLTATGDLVIEDKGITPSGVGAPTIGAPLTIVNAFKVSGSGNYSYGLDTSPAFFVVGHFYYITARWNDGSTTNGWFLIK